MTAAAAPRAAAEDNGTVVVTLTGEIDLANADEVEREIGSRITNQHLNAVVDLSDVTYIDSVGLRFLFTLAVQLQTTQIALTFVAPPGTPARRVMELAGLPEIANVEPSTVVDA